MLLWLLLPRVTGAAWADIWHRLEVLAPQEIAGLFGLWIVGLYAYAFALAACLPGLTRGQAMVVNIVGSGVSNLAPFGGTAGVAVSWWLVRGWGFGTEAFALVTAVSWLLNMVAKAVLPVVSAVVLLVSGMHVAAPVREAAAAGAVVFGVLGAVVVGSLASDTVATRTASWAGAVARAAQRLVRSRRQVEWERSVQRLRVHTRGLFADHWPTMLMAMLAYNGLQALLMAGCLWVVGGPTGFAEVLAAFACGRLLTSVVVTPGGTGFAETGAAAVLVALGGDPAASVAGVLLFSVFTYVLEIPGAGVGWITYLTVRRWRRPLGTRG